MMLTIIKNKILLLLCVFFGIVFVFLAFKKIEKPFVVCLTGKTVLQAHSVSRGEKEFQTFWTLPSDRFALSFLHSITLTPVRSEYIIKNKKIRHVKEYFTTHGYGLPSVIDDVGLKKWESKPNRTAKGKKNHFVLSLDRDVSPMIVRISKEYKSTLYIDEKTISLAKYDGKALHFSIACQKI